MEIDITDFFNSARPEYYSASAAELGDNAGVITWENAVDRGVETGFLDTEEKRGKFRAYVKTFGAWTDAEIAAWTDAELEALLIQLISGDMREGGLYAGMPDDEWMAYEARAQAGNCSGNIFGGPLCVDGFKDRVFYYVGC